MRTNDTQEAPYGAREYYSKSSNPHFKWFDEESDERAFLASSEFAGGDWECTGMWCCCACVADTPIAIPLGAELVKQLKTGDTVMAGAITGPGGALSWSDGRVEYAGEMGDPADDEPDGSSAILINFADGKNMIVSRYQLLLTTSGKLKQASRLSLGDNLVSRTGEPVTINEIKLGQFDGPRYHVGLAGGFDNGVDGHLVALNDIVVADYVLQKHRTSLPSGLVEDTVA
jgi:hypothetical protein